jgi:hypothetical protein
MYLLSADQRPAMMRDKGVPINARSLDWAMSARSHPSYEFGGLQEDSVASKSGDWHE